MVTSAITSSVIPRPTAPAIVLSDPSDLLAAVPYLLGFRPERSVVLIGHRQSDALRIGLVLRGDLPPPGHVVDQAERLVTALVRGGDTAATVVLVGPRHDGRSGVFPLPHLEFAAAVSAALRRARCEVPHVLWTPKISSGVRWDCFLHRDCGGEVSRIDESIVAATATAAGLVTYGSRDELRRQLDPPDVATVAAVARRAALFKAAREKEPNRDPIAQGGARVRAAVLLALRSEPELSDEQAVEVALALAHPRVRDACLATAVPPRTEIARAAERLWLALVRGLPAPERAEAACLLGYAAYMRGDGALAGLALARAIEDDPEHLMAALLKTALDHPIEAKVLAGLGRLEDALDLGLSPGDALSPDEPG